MYSQIIDDNYLHALRIYRDRDSKAVRLQASVHKGEMKRYARIKASTPFVVEDLID